MRAGYAPAVKKIADADDLEWIRTRAAALAKSQGVAQDSALTATWYQKIADKGDLLSKQFLEDAAQAGDAEACLLLGDLEAERRKDFDKAIERYKQAETAGHGNARTRLALVYRGTSGMGPDFQKELYWWKKAHERNDRGATVELGRLYEEGIGVKQDFQEARKLYLLAVNRGDCGGWVAVGHLAKRGRGEPQNIQAARAQYEKAADGGDADGKYWLGLLYEAGRGVERDRKKAIHLYRSAAEVGHREAAFTLAVLFERGNGAEGDQKAALEYYRHAAQLGHLAAKVSLGDATLRREGGAVQLTDEKMRMLSRANRILVKYDTSFLMSSIVRNAAIHRTIPKLGKNFPIITYVTPQETVGELLKKFKEKDEQRDQRIRSSAGARGMPVPVPDAHLNLARAAAHGRSNLVSLEESGEQGEVLLEKPLLLDYVDPLQKDDPLGADSTQDRLQLAYALWMLESGRCNTAIIASMDSGIRKTAIKLRGHGHRICVLSNPEDKEEQRIIREVVGTGIGIDKPR